MKKIIYVVLFLLLALCLALIFLLGMDMEVARQDLVRLRDKGDYEQKVEGCIFDVVCEHYTRELQQ